MKDGIMYIWNVVDGSEFIEFSCARKETADYLRDWCEAEEENRYRDSREKLSAMGVKSIILDRMKSGLEHYSVVEDEVIL